MYDPKVYYRSVYSGFDILPIKLSIRSVCIMDLTEKQTDVYNSFMPEVLKISRHAARRFLIDSFAANGFQTLPDIPAALARLEFVQMDSINVCGRIHDLVLWSRVADYKPADLHNFLYETSPRPAFEYYFPNLCILPTPELPYFRRKMEANRDSASRWGRMTEQEREVADRLFARTDNEGSLRTRTNSDEDGHTVSGWGTRTRVASFVAEKLYWQGHLGIAKREGFERHFDRIERLYHTDLLTCPLPDEKESAAFLLKKRLRGSRLFRRRLKDAGLLKPDDIVNVQVEGGYRCQVLAEDVERLEKAESLPVSDDVLLLAPLDPVVYDRARTRALFDFDYIWEVYTPLAKRRWGYYVMPLLQGERLIGRVDPKIDRKTKTLHVNSLTFEEGVNATEVLPAVTERLQDFATFLGADKVVTKTE